MQLGGGRQRAVLAVLLLHANRTLSIDRLIDEIWGGAPPETAMKMIRNAVSRLRAALEPGEGEGGGRQLLLTHPGGYELEVDPDAVDVHRFERLVREGRQALGAGEAAVAAATLLEALDLWRGPALVDFVDEPFAAAAVPALEELRLSAIEDRVDADLALGRHLDLVGELEALTAQHPVRERLRAQQMLALYRSGRQADALEVYQRTREFLVDKLGIDPSRALQRLERSILLQERSLDLEQAPAPAEREPPPVPSPVPAREVRKIVSAVVAELLVLGPRRDPEALRGPMARALETASHVLERHGGSVEKLATGAVTATFGIPAVHEDDPLRAVRAAVELRTGVAALNDELEPEWGIGFGVRAAVETGEMLVSESAAGHEVVAGDALERAARLQQAAAPGEILVGDATRRAAEGAVRVEPVEAVAVERGAELVQAWRLISVDVHAEAIVRRHAPLVGREEELAALSQALDRALRERRPYLFTVLGPAGIGKSRLAAEFVARLAGEATVLSGRCLSYGEAITFWPLAEIVGELVGDRGEPALAELVAREPDGELIAERVAGSVGLAERPIPTEEGFWALRKLFEALARDRPLVVVFEDVHWAQPTLLNLVEHVAESARDASILLLCLARPELLDERPSWGGGKLNATTILLDPLSESESLQIVEHLVGAGGLEAKTLAGITSIAEGNPLFLEQLLAMLREAGGRPGELAVPPTIQAVLSARLDRLAPEERAVLERASVIGKEFWRSALGELSPEHARGDLDAHLDALVRRDLIWPHRSLFAGDAAFRFRHILLREAAYESVPKQARADLHERFAGWLEQTAGARSRELEESVGHHLEQAYRYRVELTPPDDEHARELGLRAVERLAASGRRAHERGDLPGAVGLLSRAVALPAPPAPGQAELLLDLGEALRESGDLARAEQVLAEAAAVASSSADPALDAQVAVARMRLQLQTDPEIKTDEVLRVAEEAAGLFERAGDDRWLAKAFELLAWVPWFRCRAAAAETALLRALEHARRAGDRRTEAQSLNLLIGAAWLGPSPVADAIRRCREILAGPGESRRVRASALRALAGLHAMEGRFDEARRAIADARAVIEDLGLKVTAASAAETDGVIELLAEDPAAAERALRRGYEGLEEMGAAAEVAPVLAALLAQALYAQGRDEEALQFTERSESAAAPDDLSAHVQWRAARARVLARRGELPEAERLARAAVALAERTDFLVVHGDALVDLADVLLLAGHAAEAVAALDSAIELYDRKGNTVSSRRAAALLAEAKQPPVSAS